MFGFKLYLTEVKPGLVDSFCVARQGCSWLWSAWDRRRPTLSCQATIFKWSFNQHWVARQLFSGGNSTIIGDKQPSRTIELQNYNISFFLSHDFCQGRSLLDCPQPIYNLHPRILTAKLDRLEFFCCFKTFFLPEQTYTVMQLADLTASCINAPKHTLKSQNNLKSI